MIKNKPSVIFSCAQARAIDRCAIDTFGIPSILLMESAGRGMAEFLLSKNIQGQIVICCGKGNNGGDGFVIARYLNNADIPVAVLLLADPEKLKGDAGINYNIVKKMGVPMTVVKNSVDLNILSQLSANDWIIDAIFGIGLQGKVEAPFYEIIEKMNASAASIVAVDIPSGLDGDTGEPLGIAIAARYTLTVAAYKKGFLNPSAQKFLGEIHVIDMGVSKLPMIPAND